MQSRHRHCCIAAMLAAGLMGSSAADANDFPTLDRVQFVYECMALHGGETYTNLYSCSCMLDRIADRLPYNDYVVADSYARMQNMRGERGGMFRSGDEARRIRTEYQNLRSDAERRCFVNRPLDKAPGAGEEKS